MRSKSWGVALELLSLQEHQMTLGPNMKQTFATASGKLSLQTRSDLHLARKAWHMAMGVLIAFIYLSGMRAGTAAWILASVLGFAVFIETVRLQYPFLNSVVLRFWAPLMRAHEANRMSAVPHYLLACIFAISVFPKPVAVLSILYLACGDPLASLFGILYGDRSLRFSNGKSLIGTAAGVMTCMAITFLFLVASGVSEMAVVPVAIIGGLAGGMAELLPVDVDDNFTIPTFSGFILWLAFIAFGL